jgi:hypothetical protein
MGVSSAACLPGAPGRVPDVHDFNGVADHTIEYFVTENIL